MKIHAPSYERKARIERMATMNHSIDQMQSTLPRLSMYLSIKYPGFYNRQAYSLSNIREGELAVRLEEGRRLRAVNQLVETCYKENGFQRRLRFGARVPRRRIVL